MQRPRRLGVRSATGSATPAAERPAGIYREFEQQLAVWQRRDRAHPDRGILRLALLALEREENVAVAYSPSVLGPRVAAMRLPAAVRDLIRHALHGVWSDEEMHADYVRSALSEVRRPLVRTRTLLHQATGIVGGWTVSLRQHKRWRQAPLARALATVITWTGAGTGRVPRTVRPHLDYLSFRDFCRYNVETESTAWLCWDRLTTLAAHTPLLSGTRPDELRRIAEDEDRHRRIFAVLAEVLDDDDDLRASVTTDRLSERLDVACGSAAAMPHNEATGRTSTIPHRIDRSCPA